MAYWLIKFALTPILRFFYRVRIEGRENVPRSGPAILAGNHISFCDSIFLPLVLRRRVTFVAKAEYFDDRKTAWFFRAVGQIPIRRQGGSASMRALETAKDVLRDGKLFGIYPEGTRSPDGRLHKGHTGVARLAFDTGAPVIAVAMTGTGEVQPIGRVFPRLFRTVTVRFSEPIRFPAITSGRPEPLRLRQATDQIMFKLQELSGQEYVNRYAKRGEAVGVADVSHPSAVSEAERAIDLLSPAAVPGLAAG
ncbi:MAG TPA: lysophospholipid acyltransferase family protein [Acidimicrobiales bacterium]|nr:lysophospholipid acyltransferase family protein [Acidimicrobiales bacterium]